MIGARGHPESAFDAIRERLFSLAAMRTDVRGAVVVGLASRTPGEGVTSAVLGLASSVARTGTLRTLLISYDTGARGACSRLRLEPLVASDPTALAGSVRTAGAEGFDVLTLSPSLPSGFTGDSTWIGAFDELIRGYQLVLVDAGSMAQPLAARWSRLARLFVLVIDTTRTTQEELERLSAELQAGGRAVDAAILSKRRYRVPAFLYRYVS